MKLDASTRILLNRLDWYKVYEGGGWILYDVYWKKRHVASLLFGRGEHGKRYYRAIMYDKGRNFYSRDLTAVELLLAGPCLNPNC